MIDKISLFRTRELFVLKLSLSHKISKKRFDLGLTEYPRFYELNNVRLYSDFDGEEIEFKDIVEDYHDIRTLITRYIDERRVKEIELKILELLYKTRRISVLKSLGVEVWNTIDKL
ncbi:MAG: hypothetical protein DRP27_06345 [Thermotogae bacterium]|nr:MAG: hypothetical protein DRP27_06345 [Thermotogota bacterium]